MMTVHVLAMDTMTIFNYGNLLSKAKANICQGVQKKTSTVGMELIVTLLKKNNL